MSRLVWAATAIYALSAAALLAALWREIREQRYAEHGDPGVPLPGALGRAADEPIPYSPLDPAAPIWSELKARQFAEDVLTDIYAMPGSNEALGSEKP